MSAQQYQWSNDCALQALEAVVGQAVKHMPLLLKIIDNIAMLDMLVAFFHTITGDSWKGLRWNTCVISGLCRIHNGLAA